MAFEYQGFATLGVNLNRQKYGPLDISNVFTSEADLKYYITKGAFTEGVSEYWTKVVPYPYEGQVLATVIDGNVNVYVLRLKADGSFEAKAIEPDVDGKTIKLTNGKLELVGLPTNTTGKTYVPSFVNGELTWAEPDTSTTDGLTAGLAQANANITAVENRATALEGRATALETTVNGDTGLVGKLDKEVNDRVAADSELDGKITKALADAKKYADDEDAKVEASVSAVSARVDTNDGRLNKIEAFFGAADADGQENGLNDALDTLVEIQTFLNGEGGQVDQLLDAVAANTTDIDNLEKEFAEDGRVTVAESNISTNAAAIAAVDSRATVLENTVAGYDATNTVKNAVDAAAAKGQKGIDDAATAQAAANKAQGEVDALEGVVSTLRGEYDVTKALANTNEANISSLNGRMTTAETDIDNLEAVVYDDAKGNDKLRTDVTELQGIVKTGADANATLRADLTAVTNRVTTAEGTLATTTTTANAANAKSLDNASRLDTAEDDIDALEAIVKTGDNTNANLRTDITELQGIVKTGVDANATLGSEIDSLAAKVNHATTGLAATKAIADAAEAQAADNATRVAAVEGDYLRLGADNKIYQGKNGANVIVFNCGTATTNI